MKAKNSVMEHPDEFLNWLSFIEMAFRPIKKKKILPILRTQWWTIPWGYEQSIACVFGGLGCGRGEAIDMRFWWLSLKVPYTAGYTFKSPLSSWSS